jgi:CBS domain containing-hemolysin-like protein
VTLFLELLGVAALILLNAYFVAAEYGLVTVDAEQVSVELRRVPYSLEELQEVGLASGRPHIERHLALYRS